MQRFKPELLLLRTICFVQVYSTSRYFIGPDNLFRKFNTDANYIEYPQLNIFTSDKLVSWQLLYASQ